MCQILCVLGILMAAIKLHSCNVAPPPLKGPPLVEGKPNLLDSYLPASMQIIAHLTDLMKYDLRPSGGPTTTTTSTIRPTPSHKPGLYAPILPPGPEAYFASGPTYEDYVQRLQNHEGYGYFDRYRYPLAGSGRSRDFRQIPDDIDLLIGPNAADLLRLVNRIEDDFSARDDDDQVERFAQNYDDTDLRMFLKQKKVPPTRAYVALLSLYDMLNKESKKLGLNKFQGYAPEVLKVLAETSTGTSANQLKTVLLKIVEKRNTKDPNIIGKIEALVKDLNQDNSYINDALRYIPPLQFSV